MRIAVCPGSFDPVTYGHIDVIERTALMFDKVIVGVLRNYTKTPWYTIEERIELIKCGTSHIKNLEVACFDGMLADFVRDNGACAIVKGLRAMSDFENEFQMALINKKLAPDVETMFLTASLEFMYLSSSAIKEIAMRGGDFRDFVPPCVYESLVEKVKVINEGRK